MLLLHSAAQAHEPYLKINSDSVFLLDYSRTLKMGLGRTHHSLADWLFYCWFCSSTRKLSLLLSNLSWFLGLDLA